MLINEKPTIKNANSWLLKRSITAKELNPKNILYELFPRLTNDEEFIMEIK